MPRDMNKFDMSSESEQHPVRRGDMVYIGFFDIGIRTDLTTRRMHLRAPQKVDLQNVFVCSEWENDETATKVLENVQNVLSRCLAHVRFLMFVAPVVIARLKVSVNRMICAFGLARITRD